MTDYAQVSNDELLRRISAARAPDYSGLSDQGLLELIEAKKAQPAPPANSEPSAGEQALEGMSAWERELAGAGKGLADAWHGTKQLGAETLDLAQNFAGPVNPEAAATAERLRAEADETRERDEALMADRHGFAGNLAGNVALGVALPARRILSGIGSAAGFAGLQPVGIEDSRIDNTAIGAGWGGAGAGVARAFGRMLHPVRNAAAPGTQALIAEAEQGGYRFSAGQATGNRHLQNAEAALETVPTGGTHLRDLDAANQIRTNRTVAHEMGEDVDAITPEVIEGARTRIGAVMDNPSNGRPFNVDRGFFDEIYRIRAQYGTTLRGQQSGKTRSLIDELAAGGRARNPQISGEQYHRTVSDLRQEAEAAFRSGSKVNDARVKRELAEALEGLAERNLSGEELAAFRQARRQYSATLIAEKSVRTDGSGDIMIERLDGATKKHRRVAHRQGTEDELVRLARIGQHLKKVRIPNSGTAERSWWLRAIQSPLAVPAGVGGAGYVAGGGDPLTALGALALPYAVSRGMYSQGGQNWLRQGLPFPGRDQVINALTRLAPGATARSAQALDR